jgi:hypothetical protein
VRLPYEVALEHGALLGQQQKRRKLSQRDLERAKFVVY